jgi:hypothetical protein
MAGQLTNDHKRVKICDIGVTMRPATCDSKEIEATFLDSLAAQAKQRHLLHEFKETSSPILLTVCDTDYTSAMFKIATIQQQSNEKNCIYCFVIVSKPQAHEMTVAATDKFQNQDITLQLTSYLMVHTIVDEVKRQCCVVLHSNDKIQGSVENFGMVTTNFSNTKQVTFSITLSHNFNA